MNPQLLLRASLRKDVDKVIITVVCVLLLPAFFLREQGAVGAVQETGWQMGLRSILTKPKHREPGEWESILKSPRRVNFPVGF